jgi:ABC-type antimicrobial peptide transport system permease subunit
LTNTRTAKALLEHAGETPTNGELNIGERAVVKALPISTWHTRLYFFKRSVIMGLFGVSLTLLFVLVFHALMLSLEIRSGIFRSFFL